MSGLIIDGYNLTGILRGDLEGERQRLIDALSEYRKKKGHNITVVFDGWKDGRGHEHRSTEGGVTVIYTGLGEKADSVINNTVSKSPTPMIVISSDREIQKHAWSQGATPIDSEVFLSALERDDSIEGSEEEAYYQERGKGNPRQLSKKQKAVKRALAKL
jgi:predicted RNA-binding protein with PIN domain